MPGRGVPDPGPVRVLHADAALLVVDKPAGLVCHPGKAGPRSCLVGRLRTLAGPVGTIHLVNRLDRETSGLVLVGRNVPAARELGRLWEQRRVHKEYVGLVHGHVAADAGCIDAPLGRDTTSRVAIKDCVRADGTAARTDYRVLARTRYDGQPCTVVSLVPHTGRKHQLRIHLAHLGHPLVGDKLYGGCEDDYLALVEDRLTAAQRARLVLPNHALHARRLAFHWQGRDWDFCRDPAADWWPAAGTG